MCGSDVVAGQIAHNYHVNVLMRPRGKQLAGSLGREEQVRRVVGEVIAALSLIVCCSGNQR